MAHSGFGYIDVEPAPRQMRTADMTKFGYGLFSARYGNIYTTRQLLQLLQRVSGAFAPKEDAWEENGRFYDPFRPNIEPDGFESLEELRASRESHFRAIGQMLDIMEVFVFTLGLTEAWQSSADEAVFPACPGTVAGTFDPHRHVFRNFTYTEVRDDLVTIIALMRRIKPGLKFILTVSPVPLAATAGGDHVLTATSYSKAVLRAVAGDVAGSDSSIDYFPSYEIITSIAARSEHYEDDLRNVRKESVDCVMVQFFEQHPPPPSPALAPVRELDADDIVCEEEIAGA